VSADSVENFIQEDIFADILPPMPAKVSKISERAAEKREREELLAKLPEFRVIRSGRRKRSIQAFRHNGLIEIHIPDRLTRKQEFEIVPEMIELVLKRESKARKSDEALLATAHELLSEFLPEFTERPASVSWRQMRERWGSCTTVDRTIRISERLAMAPAYALGYVIFHELIHLRIPGHGADFELLLERHPDRARAEAFLEGYEAGSAAFGQDLVEVDEITHS